MMSEKSKIQKQNGVLKMNIANTMTVEESITENTSDVNSIQNNLLLTIWQALGQAQKQILLAWADGQKNKQIATACRMSIDNVISIKKSIRDKAQEIFPEAVIDFDFGIYA